MIGSGCSGPSQATSISLPTASHDRRHSVRLDGDFTRGWPGQRSGRENKPAVSKHLHADVAEGVDNGVGHFERARL